MIVHDLTVSEKYVRIGYIKHEKEYPQACTLKSQEYARPELYQTMKGIGMAMSNLDAARDFDVEVSKVSVKFTQDNRPTSFTIMGTFSGDDGLNLKFTTEKISVLFDKELTRNVLFAMREVEI